MIEAIKRRWHVWRCGQDKHEDVLYTVGHVFGKECRWCHRLGPLTVEDIQEARAALPAFLFTPGDDDVATKEERTG